MTDLDRKTTLLLQNIQKGDSEAMDLLLRQHMPWLLRHVRRQMPDALRARVDSMDMVQVCLSEFLEHPPAFEFENGKQLRAWILAIALNLMREEGRYWQAARRDLFKERPLPSGQGLDLMGDATNPVDHAVSSEEEGWVRSGIDLLESGQQAIICLRDYEGRSWVDIGKVLDITTDAARMRHNRACMQLLKIVGLIRRNKISELLPDIADEAGDEEQAEEEWSDSEDGRPASRD